jgi:hypothetical protein
MAAVIEAVRDIVARQVEPVANPRECPSQFDAPAFVAKITGLPSMPAYRAIRPRLRLQMRFQKDGSVAITGEEGPQVRKFASLLEAIEFVRGFSAGGEPHLTFFDAEGKEVRPGAEG